MVLARESKSYSQLTTTSNPTESHSRSPSESRSTCNTPVLSVEQIKNESNSKNQLAPSSSELEFSIQEYAEDAALMRLVDSDEDIDTDYHSKSLKVRINQFCTKEKTPNDDSPSHKLDSMSDSHDEKSPTSCELLVSDDQTIQLRFLVRRREAGALIGKRGINIKRLRESFRSSMFSIPDSGNGPERVVCIRTNEKSTDAILNDLTQLLMEKSPEYDDQIELKLLIHSSHAGSIIGIGGQSIKKLRNDSKAAIKIYEMSCPLSNERVCAIKARPPVVVSTIKLIQLILNENPVKGTIKPYDALHFDLNLVDKYGGYLPDDPLDMMVSHYEPMAYGRQLHDGYSAKNYSAWRSPDFGGPFDIHQPQAGGSEASACHQLPSGSALVGMQAGQVKGCSKVSFAQNKISEPINCDQPAPNCYLSRPTRFHPYNSGNSSSQHDFPMNRHSYPSSSNSQVHPNYGPVRQRAGPYSQISSLQERCRHGRPCLCMFMPMMPNEFLLTTPFAQLAKNFYHSRGQPHGYKKQ